MIKPMLCQDTKEGMLDNFDDNWICQDKIDGIRAVIYVVNGKVTIHGRRMNIINVRYPEFMDIFKSTDNFVIDAEIVTKDENFNHTQIRDQNNNPFKVKLVSAKYPAKIMAFDLLELNGQDLKELPFVSRFQKLKSINVNSDWVTILPIYTDIKDRFSWAKNNQKEGIIIKRIDSCYDDKRSPNWVKCKNWKEDNIKFTKYEVNSSGITVENDNGTRVLVAGQSSIAVKNAIDCNGEVTLEIQYLEKTKSGAYRMPSYKNMLA